MTPEIPDRIRVAPRTHSFEAESPTRMEAIWASSERENTLSTSADHVVSGQAAAKDERQLRAKRTLDAYQATLRDAIAGLPAWTKKLWPVWSPPRAEAD